MVLAGQDLRYLAHFLSASEFLKESVLLINEASNLILHLGYSDTLFQMGKCWGVEEQA